MIRMRLVGLALLWTIGAQLGLVQNVHAQSPSSSAVDRLFRVSGTFRPADGGAASSVETVTLSIYGEEKGGAPLWQETQQVAIDAEGRYTVLIGSTVDGVPVDLFASGEPRWLALQFLRAGEVEQARTLATSVPYALRAAKAGDADTLGGLSASAFQLAATAAKGGASTSMSPAARRPRTLRRSTSAPRGSSASSSTPGTSPTRSCSRPAAASA